MKTANEDEKLFLYSSRPAKDPSAQKLYSVYFLFIINLLLHLK